LSLNPTCLENGPTRGLPPKNIREINESAHPNTPEMGMIHREMGMIHPFLRQSEDSVICILINSNKIECLKSEKAAPNNERIFLYINYDAATTS